MAQKDHDYFGGPGNPCGRDILGAVRFAIEYRADHSESGLWISSTGAGRFRGDFICGAPARVDRANEESNERHLGSDQSKRRQLLYVCGTQNLVHTLQRTLESIIALLPGLGRWVRYQKRDGSLPANLEMLAWQVTALDQRSWLSAMGDPRPLADASQATRVGNILINGLSWPLWHGTMQSHSDLSADAPGPLPTLIGMPPKSSWPSGITSYHDVILEGYLACWVDSQRKVSVVVYGVAATSPGKPSEKTYPEPINDEILNLMKSAKLQPVH